MLNGSELAGMIELHSKAIKQLIVMRIVIIASLTIER
jgi:hypothetical protein